MMTNTPQADSTPAPPAEPEPVQRAAARGHYVQDDPPGGGIGLGSTARWTCARLGCEDFVLRADSGHIYGPAVSADCQGERRPITNTPHMAWHPWPDTCHIQGGHGWASPSSGYHDEWFFEASPEGTNGGPGTFLRGTGPTVRDAEDATWRAWQRLNACPAAPLHGPFDAKGYRNGSGYCTSCGFWMSQVLPPQDEDPAQQQQTMQGLAKATAHLLAAKHTAKETPQS